MNMQKKAIISIYCKNSGKTVVNYIDIKIYFKV